MSYSTELGSCGCCGGGGFPSPPYPCPNICGKPIGCEATPPGDTDNGWWKMVSGTASVSGVPFEACPTPLLDGYTCRDGWSFDTDVPFWNNGVDPGVGLYEQIDVAFCDLTVAPPCEEHVEGVDDLGYVQMGSTHSYAATLPSEHPCYDAFNFGQYNCQLQATFSLSCKHSNGKPVCTFSTQHQVVSGSPEGCQCVTGLVIQEDCVAPEPYTCPSFPLAADTPITLTYIGTDFVATFTFEWVPP